MTSLGVIDLGNQWNQPIALTTILINHQWYSVAYAGEQLLRNGQNIYSLSGFQSYEFNIAGASHQDHWVITGNVAFSHKISTVILKNIIWRTIEHWKNISTVNNDCMFIFQSVLFLFMPYLFVVVAKPGAYKCKEADLNPSLLSDAHMRQWTGWALLQIMACRLLGSKP